MKNNLIKRYARPVALVLAAALSSCTKLDDEVYNTIVANKYAYSNDDLARIVGTAYAPWRNVANGALTSQEWSTDAILVPVKPWGWNGTTINMHKHSWTSETGEATGPWSNLYDGVNKANLVIYQIQSGLLPVTANQEEWLAELKTVRASYYYLLCDYYGNIPYVTKWDVPAGFLPTQSTRAAVYDSVVAEVTQAMPFLSEKVDVSTYGRFTRWGAYALLAKMHLNAGVYTGTPQWEKCIQACDAIINSGKFSLAPNQKEPFLAKNENSPEAVFAVPFDESYATGLNIFPLTLNGQHAATYQTKDGGGWGGSVAIPQFIDTYDPEDNRLQENYIYGEQKDAAGNTLTCELGDVAGKPLTVINVVPGLNWAEEIHGYRLGKYEFVRGMTVTAMSNDLLPFRYTDVLMMKAESLLRLGKADEAAQIVTQVRQRAFKGNAAKAAVTGADLLQGSRYDYGLRQTRYVNSAGAVKETENITREGGDDIQYGRFLDELGWEFAQEGRRRQDMIRFGVWTKKSWLSHAATNDPGKILYPIPRTEIDKNPNLKQNPGY